MADILLATSYFLRFDPKQLRINKPYPPLATLYAAALLRARGHSVSLFDAMLEPGEDAFLSALRRDRPSLVVLYEDSFNWLAKMCLGRMRQAAFGMADAARRAGVEVVAAGPDSSDEPGLYLTHVDAVILGEGEFTLAEVVEAARQRSVRELTEVPGLALRSASGSTVKTPPRPPITDLDKLPFPAWDLVDIERYRRVWKAAHGYFSLNQITTRGCPFRCNWCAKPVYGNSYYTRSPDHLVRELLWVREHLKPDHLWYADDILGLKKSWLLRFAEGVQKHNVAIPFDCQTRVDLMTESNVAALRAAGCRQAWLGAESGAQSVLDAMDKGTTVDQIRQAADRLHRAGIRVAFFVQLGYPGERWAEITLTRRMIADCRPDEIGISVSYPLPGTIFFEQVQDRIREKDRWRDSDDLDPLFPGEYPRSFYQTLQRMIHAEFQSRRGWQSLQEIASSPSRASRDHWVQAIKLPLHLSRFAVRRAYVGYARQVSEGRGNIHSDAGRPSVTIGSSPGRRR